MNRSVLAALLVAVATVLWVGLGSLSANQTALEKPPIPIEESALLPKVRVKTSLAKPHTVVLRVNGVTEALRTVDIQAEIRGPLEAITVAKGAFVKKGDLLARIALLDRGVEKEEALALLTQRRLELEAAEGLAKKGFRATNELAAVRARFEAAQAGLERAEIHLRKLSVRAPFDGVVERRLAELGAHVDVGTPVARLIALDPILVTAYVSEEQISSLKLGDPGSAKLATGRELQGRIHYISSAADPGTRTFRVELEAPNPDGPQGLVGDGLTAELTLPIGTAPVHLVSPSALTLGPDGQIGVRLVEKGVVRFLPVEIVAQDRQGVFLSGLPEEARIITIGQEFVREGQTVEAVEEQDPAAANAALGGTS